MVSSLVSMSATSSPSSSSTILPFILPTTTSHLNVNNIVNLASVKLNQDNYLFWKSQFLAVLRTHELVGYIDGSLKCPSQFIQHDGVSLLNPEYTFWLKQEEHLASWIMATLSESSPLIPPSSSPLSSMPLTPSSSVPISSPGPPPTQQPSTKPLLIYRRRHPPSLSLSSPSLSPCISQPSSSHHPYLSHPSSLPPFLLLRLHPIYPLNHFVSTIAVALQFLHHFSPHRSLLLHIPQLLCLHLLSLVPLPQSRAHYSLT